jgi:hypothetical protein
LSFDVIARSRSDDALVARLQRAAFDYFTENVNPANGLVRDTSRPGSPASIAVVGLGLASYPIAVERQWMTRAEAAALTRETLRFFSKSPQSSEPDATGFKGFYYHFLDMTTGRRVWQCELSPIDTALLVAGMLTASAYFCEDTKDEFEIRQLTELLYRRIDWRWAQNKAAPVSQGWKPECGFLHYGWEGYNEAAILYVLAAGSPTHPVSRDSFLAWTLTYQWENLYGHDFLYAGPLFVHQFSHAFIDFRGIRDRFMREKRSDYFENTVQAIAVQREYARRNPLELEGYDASCFGISAGEGPSGYMARAVPYGPDDGTITPSATLSCLPFTPDVALSSIRTMMQRHPSMVNEDRLPSGFNPTMAWVSPGWFGLDQGIVALMIENHRSELIWDLSKKCPHIERGLRRVGFRGGWLS